MSRSEYIEMIETFERVHFNMTCYDLIMSFFNNRSKEEKLDQYEPAKLC